MLTKRHGQAGDGDHVVGSTGRNYELSADPVGEEGTYMRGGSRNNRGRNQVPPRRR